MGSRQKYWLYCIVGDLAAVVIFPGRPWPFYVLTGLVVAIAASALAGN